jgi:hypothetical protein
MFNICCCGEADEEVELDPAGEVRNKRLAPMLNYD